MDSQIGKKMEAEKRVARMRAFLAANTTAVIISAVLIVMSRAGHSADVFEIATPVISPSVAPAPSLGVLAVGTSLGSPNAPVTIVIFSDFQCLNCQTFALTTGKQLEEAYVKTGILRIIFKHFVIYKEESMEAAMASEAAAEQNRFWEYHDLLMQTRASSKAEDLTTAKLRSLAEQAGLDMAAFNATFLSGKQREKVVKDYSEGKSLGVRGTPTFFVNGTKAEGNVSFASFQKLMEKSLAGDSK